MTKSRGILPKKQFWTDEQIRQLTALYPDTKTEKIAEIMGMTMSRAYNKAHSLGLHKSAAFISSEASGRIKREHHKGRLSQFKPGLIPWNKGTHFISGGRSSETQFKPGCRSGIAIELYKPVGTERLSKDGYLERKVNDDMPLRKRWRAVHLVLWEEVNGKLPEGHAIVFKDGDKTNIALSNLECITRADLMRRNTVHNLPKELAELVQLRGALNRQINNRGKQDEQPHN